MAHIVRKRLAFLLLAGCLLSGSFFACADYTYDGEGRAVSAPCAYAYYTVIENVGGRFQAPSDLYVQPGGNVYVADTGNNRIVELDRTFGFVQEIKGFNDGKDTFNNPQGIFVDGDGSLYIADTGNRRIVQLHADGSLARVIPAPSDEALPADFDSQYKPTKVAVDSAGRIFVVSQNFNMGLIELDKAGSFVQMLGAAKVTVNPLEWIWYLIATDAQKDRMKRFVPTEYNNISIDAEGFVYVTTSTYDIATQTVATMMPVRKLTADGDDILKRHTVFLSAGDLNPMMIGTYQGPSTIVDVHTRTDGSYSILDAKRCRIFTYDGDGNLLYIFGNPGKIRGCLENPTAIEMLDDLYLVADGTKNTITVYKPTEYAVLVSEAVRAHYAGCYDQEDDIWREIFRQNGGSELALTGMGKAALRNGDAVQAMSYFHHAGDRALYSKAYQVYRRDTLIQHFSLFITLILATAVLIALGTFLIRRKVHLGPNRESFPQTVLYAKRVAFHPFDGFWDIKREKRGGMPAALLFVALLCVLTVAASQLTGFIFNETDKNTYNLLIDLLSVLGPLILFCVSNWCVSSLMDGEGKMRDIFVAVAYCMPPLILFRLIALLLSQVMVMEERAFYTFFMVAGMLWFLGLLIIAHMQTHNYTMSRSLLVLAITVLVMVILVFIGILAIVLLQQMMDFLKNFGNELAQRL